MTSFADILAPITPAQFFAEYHGRKPLHIPGAADKFSGVMSRAKLDGLIDTPGLWNAKSFQMARDTVMVPAPNYCAANGAPDPAKVKSLLANGASLVLNDIDLLAPGLDGVAAVARALEGTLEAKVQANLYSSPRERQAFASHYDTHDVYAVHVEGEKLWRIYEGCIESPIEHSTFKSQTRAFHEKAKGKVASEVLMKPGDLLYLPRGQYHDAVARSERTIHIAFGAVGVIGIDLVTMLFEAAVQDPLFRADLPRRRGQGPDTGDAAFLARVEALGRRLEQLATAPDMLNALRRFQDGFRYRMAQPSYRVTAADFKVTPQGGGWILARAGKATPIPPGFDRAVAWVVSQASFTDADLAQAMPALNADARSDLLRSLLAMKVIVSA